MSRFFKLEPAAVAAVVAALYVAGAMLYRAFVAHTGVFEPDLLVAAYAAVHALYIRWKVTPLAAPKDAQGVPLRTGQM